MNFPSYVIDERAEARALLAKIRRIFSVMPSVMRSVIACL
jgi:hypothetical protein